MAASQAATGTFEVAMVQVGREFLVRIQGQVLLAEIEELQRHFALIVTRRSKLLVLDLTHLTFISKPGVAAIMQFARDVARSDGMVTLAGLQLSLRKFFLQEGWEDLFTLTDTVGEALGDSSLALTLD